MIHDSNLLFDVNKPSPKAWFIVSTLNTLRYITICKCHRKRLTDEERPLTTESELARVLSLLTVTVLAMVVVLVAMVVMVVGGEACCDCCLLWSPRVCRDPALGWTLATGLLPPLRRAITATNRGDIVRHCFHTAVVSVVIVLPVVILS